MWQRAADTLARAGVSPNAVSVLGMGAALLAGVLLAATAAVPWWGESSLGWRLLWVGAAALVLLRLIANMLDGMVAERLGTTNPLGHLFNEAPDRISDAAILIGLGYATGGLPVLGFAAAAVAVWVAYVRALGGEAGAPSAFMGPMAKPHRMFAVILTAVLMAALPVPWTAVGANSDAEAAVYCRWCPGLPALALWVVMLGGLFTAGRRLRWIAQRLKQTSKVGSAHGHGGAA